MWKRKRLRTQKKLRARNVDTDGMDINNTAMFRRGGTRRGWSAAAFNDQLSSSEFTASDKKKYTATIKLEADVSDPRINNEGLERVHDLLSRMAKKAK